MKPVLIENLILNSPFAMPLRYFKRTFKLKDRGDAGKLTKSILSGGPAPSSKRLAKWCGASAPRGDKKQIVVLNDEAHHCYRISRVVHGL